ncbi:GGDEF domain-containing protein [Deefgea piscis]|uniref:GGDEF domain-containing protein n=1 Tax=Deefgea piscis TaxID=2739061 RepID=UPI001C7E247E|nr:GGDEF domain-containing protein [Deefgea piscis]QZA80500.1 GGDEF domain-containing protein [Deefgea piscis]
MSAHTKIITASLFLVSYLFAGVLSIQLGTINPGNMALIWLAAGIGLFTVLQLGRIGLVIVYFGSLVINTPYLFHGHWQHQIGSILISGCIFAAIDTLQSYLAARAYQAITRQHGNAMWRQPMVLPKIWLRVSFIPVAVTMPLFIALQISAGLIPINLDSILIRSMVLMLADSSGLILFVPLYPYLKSGSLFKELEKSIYFLIITPIPILINYFILDRTLILLLPLMLYIAVRFKMAATNVSLLLITLMCIGLTAKGYGFINTQNIIISLLQIQIFVFSITLALQYLAQTQTQIMHNQAYLEHEVKSRTETLAQLNHELSILATTDELTQLSNRREWQSKAQSAFLHALRYKKNLSFMMIDVDHFKKINDQYGHLFGDQILKQIAQLCVLNTRATDLVARWGGEEFVVLLPETTLEQAKIVAEKIRSAIANSTFSLTDNPQLTVTVSIGISSLLPHDQSLDDLLSRADNAMYLAKDKGRNCIQADTCTIIHSSVV